jgi:hypothetical protein
VEVTFTKAVDRKHLVPWVARNGKARIEGSILGCLPPHLPHDVVTLVVERELGIDDGFFATVAAGGTFRSMAKRRHAQGKAVIARNRSGVLAADHRVHAEWAAWLAGQPCSCASALDAAEAAWRALPPGGTLTLTFPGDDRRRRRSAPQSASAPRAVSTERSSRGPGRRPLTPSVGTGAR